MPSFNHTLNYTNLIQSIKDFGWVVIVIVTIVVVVVIAVTW
jgi:hypothetical protein